VPDLQQKVCLHHKSAVSYSGTRVDNQNINSKGGMEHLGTALPVQNKGLYNWIG